MAIRSYCRHSSSVVSKKVTLDVMSDVFALARGTGDVISLMFRGEFVAVLGRVRTAFLANKT